MLADSLLENRVLRFVSEKNYEPVAQEEQMVQAVIAERLCSGPQSVSDHAAGAGRLVVSAPVSVSQSQRAPAAVGRPCSCTLRTAFPLRLRRIAAMLRDEGWAVGKRRVQRLRRTEGLRVPPTKRKLVRRGHSTGLPTKATHRGHVWTWDFIADATVRGGALRMLTVLDEHTRECHVLRADRALKSGDVIQLVKEAIEQNGTPEYIRSDNGSEFIAKEHQQLLAEQKIRTIYIEPASPWQNGFVESIHGRF